MDHSERLKHLTPEERESWRLHREFVAKFGETPLIGRRQTLKEYEQALRESIETGEIKVRVYTQAEREGRVIID